MTTDRAAAEDELTPVTRAEIVDMQIALQLQGLGTGLAANGIWSGQWAQLYRLWLEAHRDGPED